MMFVDTRKIREYNTPSCLSGTKRLGLHEKTGEKDSHLIVSRYSVNTAITKTFSCEFFFLLIFVVLSFCFVYFHLFIILDVYVDLVRRSVQQGGAKIQPKTIRECIW